MLRGREKRNAIWGSLQLGSLKCWSSAAFSVLSLSARKVLDRLEIELAHHGGTDNGRLPVTYDQFQDFGIDRQAIAPAIRELVALGFIEITRAGRAGNAEYRLPNLFRLTYRPCAGERGDGTHEWRRIKDSAEAKLIAKAAREAAAQKKQQPVGEKLVDQCGDPTPRTKIRSGQSHTTNNSGESTTTLDISGWDELS